MLTNMWRRTIVAVFILVSIGKLCYAEERFGLFTDLTLALKIPAKDYVLFEPIPISLTLRNSSGKIINAHSALNFSEGLVDIFVSFNSDDWKKVTPLSLLYFPPNRAMLQRNYVQKEKQLLNLALNKYFQEPGTYQIVAILRDIDTEQKITSNTINVALAEPNGVDAQAIAFLELQENPGFFLSGLGVTSNTEKHVRLKDFVATYKESTLGVHAQYLLGRAFFYDKHYEFAAEQFSEIIQKTIDFPQLDEARLYTVRALSELKEWNRVDEILVSWGGLKQGNPYLEQAKELVKQRRPIM